MFQLPVLYYVIMITCTNLKVIEKKKKSQLKIFLSLLAKFLKLEQLDHDQYLPTEAMGVSMDGTGQVGTYFYTAPEVEQKWPQINEKVDMYSLGVIFFELWHPFATAMERHLVLSDLKQKGDLPKSWAAQFPAQLNLLRRLLSPSPSDRPSAVEVLQSELPPRMEDEWLNGKSLKYYFIITERTGYDLIVD